MTSGSITIGNTGTGPLTVNVSPATLTAPLSETGGGSGIVILPLGTDKVIIDYSPTKKGSSKANISITSNDPKQKKAIKVKVQGKSK